MNGVLKASPLDREVQKKSSALNADYKAVSDRDAEHLFCPILYRDEQVDLCKAHIINSSFRDSDRTWTVQRTDVDNRFGSILESDFVKLQHRGKHELIDVFTEPRLAKKLRPKFMLEGKEVGRFVADGPVPKGFSPLLVESRSGSARFALKLRPEETLAAALEKDWQVEIGADIRLQALGSLLKAAHLTLFAIIGYQYVLSAGGHFVGRTMLGDFFLSTLGATKGQALETAREHFLQFVNWCDRCFRLQTASKAPSQIGYFTFACRERHLGRSRSWCGQANPFTRYSSQCLRKRKDRHALFGSWTTP